MKKIKYGLLISLLFSLVVFYQNCSRPASFSKRNSTPLAGDVNLSNGNGQGYDLKPIRFTGNSDPNVAASQRTVDETSAPFELSGTCKYDLGDVNIFGAGLNAPINTPCLNVGGGVFSVTINYDSSMPLPSWTDAVPQFKVILATQSNLPAAETRVFKNDTTVVPNGNIQYIRTAAELQAMELNATGKMYILENDIDLAAEVGVSNNWTPLGRRPSYFGHILDGDNKNILNMDINIPGENIGFIGYGNGINGSVQNIQFINPKVVSSDDSANVGAVAGYYNLANLTNVHVFDAYVYSDGISVGGVVGFAWDGVISDVSSTGQIMGGQYVGGIVGRLWDKSIELAHSTATVTASGGGVGGIVGYVNQGSDFISINDCSFSGSASGDSAVGGIAGLVGPDAFAKNIYSNGSVASVSGTTTGPLVGSIIAASGGEAPWYIANAYYLETLSCSGCDNTDGTSLTTAQVSNEDSFIGFDFVNIWQMLNGTLKLR